MRTERFELDVAGESTDVAEAVGKRRPALVLLNDDDLAYAKIRLDEESLETAIAHLATIESPLARSLVWGSVWDATRDAEARPRDFVRLVLNNVGSETESTTLRTVLQQAAVAASSYVAPEIREETLVALGDGVLALLRQAEPGSDAQFQFAKNLAALARTDEQLQAVHGLLSGTETLEGLSVDTDLRWELLIALVAGGKAGEAEITATLAADDTATGRESAAHARATIPTAEGKRAAWDSVVDSAALPNATVRATCLGFRRAADRSLLEPYVERVLRRHRAALGRPQLRDRRGAGSRPVPGAARRPSARLGRAAVARGASRADGAAPCGRGEHGRRAARARGAGAGCP